MKAKVFVIQLFIFSFVLYACSSDGEKQSQESEITAKKELVDWNDAKVRDRVMRTIDKHFVDNSIKKGLLHYYFQDMITNKRLAFVLSKIETDSIYPLSEKRVFMKVRTVTDKGDSLVFDYEVSVKQAELKPDSLIYEVQSLNLRKVNQEQRYLLKKEGNFWAKEILAVAQVK
ncbi:hypothetical protein [Thermoflexibacter ruber]|uniref:Lipoprotein n=1 Tax=Thermoflexibacter ruber TaxID=1003 RepID=A0A1I2DPP9_9BACT|nr:hypothetical protein [Thermoflexibacter ruber]SFE82409.1 hypothetical protein SAMN04488541_1007113 [Thermoflexibacter ruber]